MKRLHITSVLAAAVLLLGTACSSVQPVATQVSDADINTRLNTRLAADPEVSATAIDVDVQDGYVRLRGTVESDAARAEAGEIAHYTRGVRGVSNELAVGEKTAGEMLDDAAITTKVNARLAADLATSATNIDVDTSGGTVTLSGLVQSERARAEAEELARRVDGVERVDNELQVEAD